MGAGSGGRSQRPASRRTLDDGTRRPSRWLLEARNVTKRFGGLTAVKSLTMNVAPGALYGLIGPNGAGKTTVFNLLTGVYDPTEGEIHFDGTRIDGEEAVPDREAWRRADVSEHPAVCRHDRLENVMAAHHLRTRQMLADAVLGTGRHHAEETRDAAIGRWSS